MTAPLTHLVRPSATDLFTFCGRDVDEFTVNELVYGLGSFDRATRPCPACAQAYADRQATRERLK